ncbi:MAG: ATP synthase subunit I [Candidatus Thiothrix singaporensis]|uniref:ATP synthase subunit I n=1 Tax=Candidatus Thiothrix singaporensis TaxID=2799669 RepID=A0A7L6AUA6_9GAMM|nr:MAG: ATP synthase subunit I [Candidatus Thiothrix singaporensis]
MIEHLTLPLIVGLALGMFFFGGLWWTVRKGSVATNPALWFFTSFMLRTGVALAGFYAIAAGDWQRLLAALAGFVLARMVITRFAPAPQESNHASQLR